jgi:hypothetical protein
MLRSAAQSAPERRDAVITGVTEIAHITTKQDMSRWTRAHADMPGIRWSVFAGEGGTMIIVEHAEDRCSQSRASAASAADLDSAASLDTVPAVDVESTDIVSLSA